MTCWAPKETHAHTHTICLAGSWNILELGFRVSSSMPSTEWPGKTKFRGDVCQEISAGPSTRSISDLNYGFRGFVEGQLTPWRFRLEYIGDKGRACKPWIIFSQFGVSNLTVRYLLNASPSGTFGILGPVYLLAQLEEGGRGVLSGPWPKLSQRKDLSLYLYIYTEYMIYIYKSIYNIL